MRRLWLTIALVLLTCRGVSAQTFASWRGTPVGSRQTTVQTTHPITLPGHIAGDLLLVFFAADTVPTVTIDTGGSSTGWTQRTTATSGGAVAGVTLWLVTTTSAETLTLTTSTAVTSSNLSIAIQNAGAASFTSSATGSSTNSDPPSLTPAGGSADYLWIVARLSDSNVEPTVAPTNFTDLTIQSASSSNGTNTAVAQRNFTGSVLDPGAFTSATEQWICFTVAVPYVLQAQSTSAGQLLFGVGQ